MRFTLDQLLADRRRMRANIASRLPEEGCRVVLADGEDGEFWVDLNPIRYGDGELDLHWETNCPEWAGIREIADHFGRQEMMWEGESSFLPEVMALAGHRQPRRCKDEAGKQEQTGLLRLRQCVTVSGHSESSLRRAIRDGRLRAHTIGRGRKRPTYGIYRADLEGFIEASRVELPDPPVVPITTAWRKSRHFD